MSNHLMKHFFQKSILKILITKALA